MVPSWIGVLKIQLKFSNFSRDSMCVQVNIPPFAQLERLLLRTAIGIWLLMKRQFTGILEYHRLQSKDHCCLEMWTHSTTINYIHLYTISGRLELFLFHDCRWKSSFSAWAVPFQVHQITKCHDFLRLCSSGSKRPAAQWSATCCHVGCCSLQHGPVWP
jgi:hypothetical protein